MKKKILRGIALMLSMVFLTGCSQKEEEAPPELLTLAEYSVPVTIDGIEIVVGTTTLQPLLDAGLSIMVSEWTGDQVLEREIDPEEILAAGTSETDISFWITDSAFARLSLEAADTDVRMGDAVVSRLALHLSHLTDTLPDNISIDGVPVTELSRARAGEMFPDYEQEDLSIMQQGEDYKCTFMFMPGTYALYQFSLVKGEKEESILPPSTIW
ncbi:MAG: hypothetical protein HFI18_09055 [Lachnospiraceae bacterium]|jgi:hypothetical protein|nr:hypothetical protein [Lachnospiraceae bacterium]